MGVKQAALICGSRIPAFGEAPEGRFPELPCMELQEVRASLNYLNFGKSLFETSDLACCFRFIAALQNRSEEDELKFTTDMINTNFSNYSAWHNRR